MLAGDATDTLEQLHARRADAIGPDPKASHDPESASRLAGAIIVS